MCGLLRPSLGNVSAVIGAAAASERKIMSGTKLQCGVDIIVDRREKGRSGGWPGR